MYKNFRGESLGISGRQNEVVELALTYSFKGIDVDITEMASRADAFGVEFARRFLESSQINIGGFRLPIDINGSDDEFKSALELLRSRAELAASVGATRCHYEIQPASDQLPYHENFEQHRQRIGEIADVFAEHQIKLGIGFRASAEAREGKELEFIYQAEPVLTLLKTIGRPNVGLALDAWNWVVGSGGLDQLSELDSGQFVSVCLAELDADADPVNVSEKERRVPANEEGSFCRRLIAMLREKNYDGPISIVAHASQFGGKPRDVVVRQLSDTLDKLLSDQPASTQAEQVAVAAE